MDIHVVAAGSNNHSFCGVPVGSSGYAHAARFPSGDHRSSVNVKFNSHGTSTVSKCGHSAAPTTHKPGNRTSCADGFAACRNVKKYSSPNASLPDETPGSASTGSLPRPVISPNCGNDAGARNNESANTSSKMT